MKTSNVISHRAQEHFWHVVRECLQEFHHASEAVFESVSELRRKVEDAPIEEIELFFHGEPFHVACALAHNQLPIEPYLQRYLDIRDSRDNQEQ